MDRVHDPAVYPFDRVGFVAVAIGAVSPGQRHTGIVYRDSESETLHFLHLAWHYDLCNEDPEPDFLWVDPAIHWRRARQVAAVCRNVWRANGKLIPYAFTSPAECFDTASWDFLFGPTRLGLTCASFVLAVFHAARLALVDYSGWPTNRDGDSEWQQMIVSRLTGRASPEHIEAITRGIGSVRFRPEEVAGAATVAPIPASFDQAVERGAEILTILEPKAS